MLVGLIRRFGQMGCLKHVGVIVTDSNEKFYLAIASRLTSSWHARSEKAYQGGVLGFY